MNTNQLKKFAKQARIRLINDVTRRYLFWGLDKDGDVKHSVEPTSGGFIFRSNVYNDGTIPKKWNNLLNAVKHHTPKDIIEEASYTWFNRLIAIKILEKNGYDAPAIGYAENRIDPVLLQNAKRGNTPRIDEQTKRQLQEYITESKDDEALSLLLIHYCRNHKLLNRLFGQIDDYTELLLPNNLLAKDGIISLINRDEFITDDDYKQVELIGWLYQFYISDKKDDVFAGFKKKKKARAEDIPAATQIFTPKWIVKYLVENTVGRIWLDKHPESPIREMMKYLVEPESPEPSEPIIDNVTELKVLDPAVGSGHFLVVAFDLLMQVCKEEGYTNRYAVESIITHNLYGLDICKRAVGLANFAVLLKGASYYPDILNKDVVHHIAAMPEQYDFSLQQITDFLGENGRRYTGELQTALEAMQMAQNIGSALVIDLTDGARDFIAKRLNEFTEKQKLGELDLIEIGLLNTLKTFLQPILMLTDTYTAVVANPPYMGSKNTNAELSDYLKTNYPKSKLDLFAVFMEVCTNRSPKSGFMGMINQHSWMFLSSYEKLREEVLDNFTITNMLHLGPRLFEELSGEIVQSTAFALKKESNAEFKGDYYRLVDYKSSRGKEEQFEQRNHHFNHLSQNNFSKIPGSPIAYWVSESVIKVFENKLFYDYSVSDGQNKTGKNKKYLRLHWEVNHNKIIYGKDYKWIFYAKGGYFRKWYGNTEHIIDWSAESRTFYRRDHIARLIPEYMWFRKGISWSLISSGENVGFRILKENSTFDVTGSSIFFNEINIKYFDYFLGFLNTKIVSNLFKISNPTVSLQVKDIRSLPIIFPESQEVKQKVNNIASQNINISKYDWDSHETSWDFEQLPLLNNSSSLHESYTQWEKKATADLYQLHKNEEELNRIFIDIYGLQDELTPSVPLKDITILQEELDRTELQIKNEELRIKKSELPIKRDVVIKQLLSYSVGCFMGRYRLDKPGLNIAHPNPTEEELSAYSYNNRHFEIDDDGIIPTMGGESPFSDDIVFRVKEFIQMVWGEDTLTENLNFINECLGEDLEKYLTKKFWNDHKKRYKKRPIYWQFASPMSAFKVIVYMHRMNRFTVQKIRQNYLFKQVNWLEREISQLAENEALLASKESKRLDKLRKNLIECREYDLLLKDVSDKQIEFDLDDGVTENYKLFDGVVSMI